MLQIPAHISYATHLTNNSFADAEDNSQLHLGIIQGDRFRDDYSRALIHLANLFLKTNAPNPLDSVICDSMHPNLDAISSFLTSYLTDKPISAQAFPEATVSSGSTTINRVLGALTGNLTINTGGSLLDALFFAASEADSRRCRCHLFFGEWRTNLPSVSRQLTHVVIEPSLTETLTFDLTPIQSRKSALVEIFGESIDFKNPSHSPTDVGYFKYVSVN